MIKSDLFGKTLRIHIFLDMYMFTCLSEYTVLYCVFTMLADYCVGLARFPCSGGLSLSGTRTRCISASPATVNSKMAEAPLRTCRYFCHRCSEEISPPLPVSPTCKHVKQNHDGRSVCSRKHFFFGGERH